MKRTPLYQTHVDLGAKMVPFAGYEMPLKYDNIIDEHKAVRKNAGMFDVSHMGQFIVKGKEAMSLIQVVSSNDVANLEIGDAQYSAIMNPDGGIVDDMIVYRLDEDQCSDGEQAFMLVVNASNMEKDLNYIKSNNNFDTRVIDISDTTGLLAIQGPNACEILQSHTEVDLAAIEFYKFKKGTFAGIENVLISATGYTGAGGLELYVDNKNMVQLWTSILGHGKKHGLVPVGLGARDTLRLEMGYALYGNDIDDTTSPIDAGLNWICKPDKTPTFVGIEPFLERKQNKKRNALVGFTMEGKRIPRQGYNILNEEEEVIGRVTSGAMSPSLDLPIGMGYVPRSHRKTGTKLKISVGKKALPAVVTKLPFIK